MRQHAWFDDAMLLPGERLVRWGAARLRIDGPPGWWEGRLILTGERLFFLPDAEHDRIGPVAFWLTELDASAGDGGRLLVRLDDEAATFDLPGAWPPIRRVNAWLDDIARARGGATMRPPLRDPRRAGDRGGHCPVPGLAGGDGSGGSASTLIPTRTPTAIAPPPTPLPATWVDGLWTSKGGRPVQLSCQDGSGDGRLDAADGAQFVGLQIALAPGQACVDPARRADYYAGPPSDAAAYSCGAPKQPVLIVVAASAGSNLLDPSSGESMGVLAMVAALQRRAADAGIATDTVLATSALFGADMPQTRMEQWLTREVARRLDAMPCLRAVLIGHSHGGVTVTSVTAALDARFAPRMYGVILDRTTVLYDRNATQMPERTPILNLYQLNEGWHGEAIGLPNVTDVDASKEQAPIAPSDGGGGPALVSHKTLDDAPAVQRRIEDAVMAWLGAG